MQIPRTLVSRDTGSTSSSTDSSSGRPQNLGLILGVAISVVVVILLVLLIVWRIIVVKRRQESGHASPTNTESLSRPPEKFTSNTLRGFKFPHKSEPAAHPRIDPYVLPQPPAPTVAVASASADSFGNTASSEYHYKTWRTVASSRSIDDPHMFADRTSQTSSRMQARDGLHSTGEMKDLINMFNSQRVESAAAPPPAYPNMTLSPSLAVKPMRPISVASTLVAPHTVTKDFGSMPHGLQRNHSVERASDGYNSDATVPSVMRRPKFNPREGAPVIPSIYFQPFELDDPNTFLARSNSMDSRRTSSIAGGPHRVPSQLGRSPSARQNYPPVTTRKRQNSEPPKIPPLPRLSTITDGAQSTHTHTDAKMILPMPLSLAPRASVAPSVSEYPESRAGSIYIDPDMPLSRAPLSPTVVPSRNNSARSGWI